MKQCARCGEIVKLNECYVRVTVHGKELKMCDGCLYELCSFLSKSHGKTNGDMIRNKSDKELADLFDRCFMSNKAACNFCAYNNPDSDICDENNECKQGFYLWLSKER